MLVRCADLTVFPVDPVTLEPLACATYDHWCFSDPKPDVTYINYFDWLKQKEAQE